MFVSDEAACDFWLSPVAGGGGCPLCCQALHSVHNTMSVMSASIQKKMASVDHVARGLLQQFADKEG